MEHAYRNLARLLDIPPGLVDMPGLVDLPGLVYIPGLIFRPELVYKPELEQKSMMVSLYNLVNKLALLDIPELVVLSVLVGQV